MGAAVMATQSTGAGRFAGFDLSRVPSPCFVIDEVKLRENLSLIADISQASNARILMALKAFSMWSLAPLISDYLHGCCASGLWEAKLARAHFAGLLGSYAPAYKPSEAEEIAALSDHMIFNTPQQLARFGDMARRQGAALGMRVNPEHSEGEIAKYDPCAAGSRLGSPVSQLDAAALAGVEGVHMHSLCEQHFAPLERTVAAIAPLLDSAKGQLGWLNLGGGHLLSHPDYDRSGLVALLRDLADKYGVQLYLEPGAAVVFDAGILVGEVLDVMDNDGVLAITDISASCHMPDVLEAPYRPALLGEPKNAGMAVRLGGPTCLAGDVIGTYHFDSVPRAGQRLAFLDQAHYSMVKTTTFNGVGLPALAIWNSDSDALRMVRQFDYSDFEGRLS
ncbi:MAG: carboxynorspermidine decarboxylase [Parvibaculales bacterium]